MGGICNMVMGDDKYSQNYNEMGDSGINGREF
jgi:hypothetical protein